MRLKKTLMGEYRAIESTTMRLATIQDLVDEQAKDAGLWFVAQTAPEAYLQQELRRLHTVIETGRDPRKGEVS